MEKQIESVALSLQKKLKHSDFPELVVILGSGFLAFKNSLKVESEINLSEVEGFLIPKVKGHGSKLIIGKVGNHRIAVVTGRIHLYEGHSAADVVMNLRVFHKLGMKKILLTNAAGGLSTKFKPGDIVAIKDHINATGQNCLVGYNDFIDMSEAYKPSWVMEISKEHELKTGVYIGVLGPTFETPAETKMYSSFADMAGMSTVQETICAAHLGVEVMALSMITNLAGGLGEQIEHDEVLKMASSNDKKIVQVLSSAIEVMAE